MVCSGVYLSLNGDIIPNHGYVMISDIGSTDNTALLCITNKPAPPGDVNSGGDWFAPDGVRVGVLASTAVPGFGRNKGDMVVRLRRNSDTEPEEGIYYCVVEDSDFITQTVYVGLYHSGGGNGKANINIFLRDPEITLFPPTGMVTISHAITLTVDSDLNGDCPQFTLTCISTGGPATTVTWTRGSETAVGTQRSAVVDGVTAQYTHTLTVTERLPGVYTCTVDNYYVPSDDSDSLRVQGIVYNVCRNVLLYMHIMLLYAVASAPTDLTAVQEGLTSIRVSWTPSSDATGYVISYTGGGSSDSVTVSGGSTDNYLLTGLVMDVSYILSIVATSQHFFSDVVAFLGEA